MRETKPSVGDGVTIHERGAHVPGTVLGVSSRGYVVSYRWDVMADGTPPPFPPQWVHRAIRQADGSYRDENDLWPVELGVRRPFRRQQGGFAPSASDLGSLETALERIEPFLLKTRWFPMTHLMIPGVLRSADELIAAANRFTPRDASEEARIRAVRERITALRAGFEREVPLESDQRAKLDRLYRATTFVADLKRGPYEIRIGRPAPELDASAWAYITAWNPHSRPTSRPQNEAAQRQFEEELNRFGVPFARGKSRPDDGSEGEASVLAPLDREEAIALGRRLRQNAIVVGAAGAPAELVWLR